MSSQVNIEVWLQKAPKYKVILVFYGCVVILHLKQILDRLSYDPLQGLPMGLFSKPLCWFLVIACSCKSIVVIPCCGLQLLFGLVLVHLYLVLVLDNPPGSLPIPA